MKISGSHMHYDCILWIIFRNLATNNEIAEDGCMQVFVYIRDVDDDMTVRCPAALTAVMNTCREL